MQKFLSPSMLVSLVGVLISLGGAGYSATGGNFLLGKANTASTRSTLTANIADRPLQLINTSTAATATALGLTVNPQRPPMIVNSNVKVANLNADLLDGFSSGSFPRSARYAFNLTAGAVSPVFFVPADRPVSILGSVGIIGGGVAQVAMSRETNGFFRFAGIESASSGVTSGAAFHTTSGAHVIYIDANSLVDIETASNGIQVHNEDTISVSGLVTLMW